MRIAIIYGGKSEEHEISIRSAKNVYNQIKSLRLTPVLIGIDKFGKGYLQHANDFELNSSLIKQDAPIYFSYGNGIHAAHGKLNIDCAIPLIHGTYGEDGCLQGALELCQTPYIGEDVKTSALCMDKHLTKIILEQSNINVTPYSIYHKNEEVPDYNYLSTKLGYKLIVKPSSSGSSFGVTVSNSENELKQSLKIASSFSKKILIEKFIKGREINCAIFGNEAVIGNLGEIININSEIYSYEEKYILKSNRLEVPAVLNNQIENKIKALAKKCYVCLNCKSMARIDVFIDRNDNLFVNEVNTIPAFSKNSIFPKLLESVGISQREILSSLINQETIK